MLLAALLNLALPARSDESSHSQQKIREKVRTVQQPMDDARPRIDPRTEPLLASIVPILRDAGAQARRMAPDARLYGVAMKHGYWDLAFHEAATLRQLIFTYYRGKLVEFELRQIVTTDDGYKVLGDWTDFSVLYMNTQWQEERVDKKMRKMLKDGRWWKPGLPPPDEDVGRKPLYRQPCTKLGAEFMGIPKLLRLSEGHGLVLSGGKADPDLSLLLFHPATLKRGCMGLFEHEHRLPAVADYPPEVTGKDIWVVEAGGQRLFLDARAGTLIWKAPVGG